MGFFDMLGKVAGALIDEAEKSQKRQQKRVGKMVDDYEKKLDRYEKVHPSSSKIEEERVKIANARERISNGSVPYYSRRTDSELESDMTGLNKRPRDFQYRKGISLKDALHIAENETGVYILYLNGSVMKCGRAAYGQGIHWRFQQYYSLKYDNRARNGDYWSVSPENRDRVTVAWQCCPVSKCKELEYKLFRKYGKGLWAIRAPESCSSDTWELLI